MRASRHRRAVRAAFGGRAVLAAAVAAGAIAGCGGDAGSVSEPVRSYTVRVEIDDATDGAYRYLALDPVDIEIGDEVTFEMTNTGSLGHDMNVYGPGGELGGVPTVAPGDTARLTVVFDEAGAYQLRCFTDDHLTTHRMFAAFDVTEPDDRPSG